MATRVNKPKQNCATSYWFSPLYLVLNTRIPAVCLFQIQLYSLLIWIQILFEEEEKNLDNFTFAKNPPLHRKQHTASVNSQFEPSC